MLTTEFTKTYLFQVEVVHEDDGRWSAGVPALPGCATWGSTREEALRNLRDAVEAYLRDVQKAGEEIPQDASFQVINGLVVAVTV
jgi:predicted RNase H-like HicB family nuclease